MIMEKLQEVMNPQYDGEEKVNPFDLWEGADFKLKIRNKEGYRNYDRSEFSERAPITNPNGKELSDAELDAVVSSMHSLKEIVDPKNFKSYGELKAKLYKVLALDGSAHAPMKATAEDDDTEMDFTPKFKERAAPKLEEAPSPTFKPGMDDDDDDSIDFFKALAED